MNDRRIEEALDDTIYRRFGLAMTLIVKGIIDIKSTAAIAILTSAIFCGKTKTVKYLLRKGVDINTKDYNGHTPLEVAIKSRHRATAKLVIEKTDKEKSDDKHV